MKIWDIRARNEPYTIPAHSRLVSSVATSGEHIITGSYDNTVKMWNSKTVELVSSLNIGSKVTSVSQHGLYVAVCCFDRTCKLWQIYN